MNSGGSTRVVTKNATFKPRNILCNKTMLVLGGEAHVN